MTGLNFDRAGKDSLVRRRMAQDPPPHPGPDGSRKYTLEMRLRARLVRDNPAASHEEIEAMLGEILVGGAKRSDEQLVKPRGVPKAVLAARRAERKRQFKKGRSLRRPNV